MEYQKSLEKHEMRENIDISYGFPLHYRSASPESDDLCSPAKRWGSSQLAWCQRHADVPQQCTGIGGYLLIFDHIRIWYDWFFAPSKSLETPSSATFTLGLSKFICIHRQMLRFSQWMLCQLESTNCQRKCVLFLASKHEMHHSICGKPCDRVMHSYDGNPYKSLWQSVMTIIQYGWKVSNGWPSSNSWR